MSSISVGIDTWSTRDRSLAAWVSLHEDVVFVARQNGVMYWYFHDNEQVQELVEEFKSGDALADPAAYIHAYHHILHDYLD